MIQLPTQPTNRSKCMHYFLTCATTNDWLWTPLATQLCLHVSGQRTSWTKSAKLVCGSKAKKQPLQYWIGEDGSNCFALHNVQTLPPPQDVWNCYYAGRRIWCCREMGGHEKYWETKPRLVIRICGHWYKLLRRQVQFNRATRHWTIRCVYARV